ncbi:MAG: glycosyltransferase family 9 protein [Bacteriovoracaceae bacterium]|jgi:ADP-heptose:LPS heptosyltransferase|nr:glycosyltransferase family 9 protein [Bacteriovoracaceae bacterium]
MSAKKLDQNENTETPPNAVKKTICLVQLTRIGDVIQVLQAANRLKETRDDIELAFIGRERFSKPLEFLLKQVFDYIYYINLPTILNKGQGSLDTTMLALNDFLEDVNQLKISALINYSYSRSSGYLCSLIHADHRLGVHFDNNSNLLINDNWSQYVYSNVLGTELNPFSLVDLYFKTLGVKPYIEEIPIVRPVENKNIVIHPFASSPRKRWKENKWIEIIYKILKEHPDSNVSIVGSKEDIGPTNIILNSAVLSQFRNRIMSHVGLKNIEEVYHLLGKSDLFIGHDSMVGHLASLQSIQTLTISLGTVRPIETSPYLAGGYVLSPRTNCFPCKPSDSCQIFQCHLDITHQLAFSVINLLLNKQEITEENIYRDNISMHVSSANLYRSDFSKEGLFRLNPIIENRAGINEILAKIYRVNWSFIINDSDETIKQPELNKQTHAELLQTLQGLTSLYELAEFGKKYSKYILEEISSTTPDILKIKDYSAKIDEIDALKDIVKKSHPGTAPIINYYKMKKGNLAGNNLVQLTESSYLVYHECAQCCSIVYELIEQTIAEYKLKNNITLTQNDQSL